MFEAVTEEISSGQVLKITLVADNRTLSYKQFIFRLTTDEQFRQWLTGVLANAPCEAFRWETPVLTSRTETDPFEFVIINAPALANRAVDSQTFSEYFIAEENKAVMTFKSLGGDAKLIVPSPQTDHEHYSHLASFLRGAPASQISALWQMIGQVMSESVGDAPLWLNTEGSGVAWLHVRIDSRPKYYGYAAYMG